MSRGADFKFIEVNERKMDKILPLCNKLLMSLGCKTPVTSVELHQGWIWSHIFALKSLSAPKQ